jgi:AraC family transcriptional regulator of adaptative response / DNA-3-methyladenine glycosylase II
VTAGGEAPPGRGAAPAGGAGSPRLHLLRGAPPFDAARALAFLAFRAVPGVEDVDPYRRALRLAHGAGVATLTAVDGGVQVELDLDDARDETEALDQLAFVLDLDAPAAEIADVLGRDAALRFTPGLRVPGGEGYEIAVRAVLTQQISVKAGRTHAGRLVAAAGEPLARPRGSITHLFPTPEAIAAAPDDAFAMPARRRETLRSLAGADLRELTALPGIGPWTQAYVDMRALRDRDAWLGTDLVVRQQLGALDPGAWRPFRAYAVVRLWDLASSRTTAAKAATSGERSRSRQASAMRSGSTSASGTHTRSGRA